MSSETNRELALGAIERAIERVLAAANGDPPPEQVAEALVQEIAALLGARDLEHCKTRFAVDGAEIERAP